MIMVFKQMRLFDEKQGNVFLKKHSALAQINNVTSLVQRKAMNAILWIAKDQLKRDPNTTYFEVDIGVLKHLAGVSNRDNRGLKKGLRSLVSLVVEYNILKKDTYERGAFPFLSYVKIEGEQAGQTAKVVFSLSPIIQDSLVQPNMYVKLNLFLQRGFKSKYSLALFEVLSDYANLGKLRLEVDVLKKLLGIDRDKYTVFAMFRKKVLDMAMNEINELTTLEVTYELEKVGRRWGMVIFHIKGRIKETPKSEIKKKIIKKLGFYGFLEKQIGQLLNKHDEDYLMANIGVIEEQLQQGKSIKNVRAYMSKAFQVDFRKTETEYDKIQKEKEQAKAQKVVQEQQKEQELAKLEGKYKAERKAKIEALKAKLSDSELEELKKVFEKQVLESGFISKKLYETKGFNHSMVQAQRNKFLGKKYLASEYQNFENYRDKNF